MGRIPTVNGLDPRTGPNGQDGQMKDYCRQKLRPSGGYSTVCSVVLAWALCGVLETASGLLGS